MNRKSHVATQFVIALLTLTLTAGAQQSPPSVRASEKSYREARRVLDAGLQALGGLERIRAIKTFTLKESGRAYSVNQSVSADPPFLNSPIEETTIVDIQGGRLFNELKN
ncbi:MAG: hypothetical protein ACRD68_04885, partial [Pyrinomonadaceae bacterium]